MNKNCFILFIGLLITSVYSFGTQRAGEPVIVKIIPPADADMFITKINTDYASPIKTVKRGYSYFSLRKEFAATKQEQIQSARWYRGIHLTHATPVPNFYGLIKSFLAYATPLNLPNKLIDYRPLNSTQFMIQQKGNMVSVLRTFTHNGIIKDIKRPEGIISVVRGGEKIKKEYFTNPTNQNEFVLVLKRGDEDPASLDVEKIIPYQQFLEQQ